MAGLARILASACAAATLLSAAALARAEPKVELGFRTGYGTPFGSAYGAELGQGDSSTTLRDGIVPEPDISCSTADMRLGLRYAYHLGRPKKLDPWLGIGIGYEWARSTFSRAPDSIKMSLRGWEFVNLEVGLDVAATEHWSIAPFVAFGLARFSRVSTLAPPDPSASISDRTLHEWLFLGVRGSVVP